jgi:hypothetical protein
MKHKIYALRFQLLPLLFSFLIPFFALAQENQIPSGKWLLQSAVVTPKAESNVTLTSTNCLLCALKESKKPLVINSKGTVEVELGTEGYKMQATTKGNSITFISENTIEVSGDHITSSNQKVKSYTTYTFTQIANKLTLQRADAQYSETYTFTK